MCSGRVAGYGMRERVRARVYGLPVALRTHIRMQVEISPFKKKESICEIQSV